MSRLRFTSLPVIYRADPPSQNGLEMDRGRKCALVVDDDKDVVTLIAAVLCASDFYVYPAFDGAEGLERFTQVKPDVVILDVLMPKMDGWAVLKKIRALSPEVPVVMLTVMGDSSSRDRGEVMAVTDFVTKPFVPRELASRVTELAMRMAGRPA